MGQLNAPPNNPPLPPLTPRLEFEFPYIQRLKDTPFIKALLYSYEPSIYVERMDIKLATILTPRLNTKGHFPETEVFKLVKGVTEALAYLESKGIRYGDLTAQTIYYDKTLKGFKIIHPHLIQQTSYQLTKTGKRFSLLSPQLLLYLTDNKERADDFIIQKSDLFTFGLILMEVCSLKSSSEIYDEQTYNIIHPKIVERMNSINKYYSERIFKIVLALTEYDMNLRKNAREIKLMVDEYERNPVQVQPQAQNTSQITYQPSAPPPQPVHQHQQPQPVYQS